MSFAFRENIDIEARLTPLCRHISRNSFSPPEVRVNQPQNETPKRTWWRRHRFSFTSFPSRMVRYVTITTTTSTVHHGYLQVVTSVLWLLRGWLTLLPLSAAATASSRRWILFLGLDFSCFSCYVRFSPHIAHQSTKLLELRCDAMMSHPTEESCSCLRCT